MKKLKCYLGVLSLLVMTGCNKEIESLDNVTIRINGYYVKDNKQEVLDEVKNLEEKDICAKGEDRIIVEYTYPNDESIKIEGDTTYLPASEKVITKHYCKVGK